MGYTQYLSSSRLVTNIRERKKKKLYCFLKSFVESSSFLAKSVTAQSEFNGDLCSGFSTRRVRNFVECKREEIFEGENKKKEVIKKINGMK